MLSWISSIVSFLLQDSFSWLPAFAGMTAVEGGVTAPAMSGRTKIFTRRGCKGRSSLNIIQGPKSEGLWHGGPFDTLHSAQAVPDGKKTTPQKGGCFTFKLET